MKKVIRKAIVGAKKKKEKEEKPVIQKQTIQQPIIIQQVQQEGFRREEVKPKPSETIEKGISLIEAPSAIRMPKLKDMEEDLTKVNIKYALIPRNSKNPYAWAHIKWSIADSSLVYYVYEPELTEQEKKLLEKIKQELVEKLDVDFTTLKKGEAKEYLVEKFKEMVKLMAKDLPIEKQNALLYYIERDFIGLGKIEPLMQDPDIEDISCDGVGIPIYIYHRNPLVGSVKTNIMFETADELDTFVNKLAQRCGKSISVANPLLQGALPDGSRVQATLGTDIARRGSNITIRKFTKEPLTPTHIINFGTLDKKLTSYLWILIEYGRSILISGGTASGKTSLLNALSLFINPNLKVVSIEDTPELSLPLPHWVPTVARTSISEVGAKKIGEVDLFDLLKESLRQRPDYLIVGEVRGKEAYVLFQQIASIPGYETVLYFDNNCLKKTAIENLKFGIQYNIPTLDPFTGKVSTLPIKYKIKHRAVDKLYKIITKSGREIIATSAHSVFTYDGKIIPIMVQDLKVGSEIIIPAKLPSSNEIKDLDLIKMFKNIRVYSPELIKKASKKLGFKEASKIANVSCISHYYGVNNCAIKSEKFIKLMKKANIDWRKELKNIKVKFRGGNSPMLPAKLKPTPELLRLIGYYISEGSLNTEKRNCSISLYNSNKKILEDMRKCIEKVTGKKARERIIYGWGKCTELTFNHRIIFELLKKYCKHGSKNKKIPDFIFNLPNKEIGHFLTALWAGDGSFKKDKFYYSSSSKELINDICYLLLKFGIVARIAKKLRKQNKIEYEIRFYTKQFQEKFLKYVKCKNNTKLNKHYGKIHQDDYYRDKVKSIEVIELKNPEPVYDLYVPRINTFIGGFGGVLLHNTGHPSMATIHADTMDRLIDRLTTPPISLPKNLIEALDVIIFLVKIKYKNRYVRKVSNVYEIVGYDRKENRPIINEVFKWDPSTDTYKAVSPSIVFKRISEQYGVKEDFLKLELSRREKILNWVVEHDITNYKDFAKIVKLYYTRPEDLLSSIQ